jgi:hypothetical protein
MAAVDPSVAILGPGKLPAWVCPIAPTPSSIMNSTRLFEPNAFIPEEFYPPGRVRRPKVTEKPPNVTVEPTKTPEEMAELVDFSVPLEFVTPLIPSPDNAKLEQDFLRGKSIDDLLMNVK